MISLMLIAAAVVCSPHATIDGQRAATSRNGISPVLRFAGSGRRRKPRQLPPTQSSSASREPQVIPGTIARPTSCARSGRPRYAGSTGS